MTSWEEQHESPAIRTAFLADYAKIEPTGLFSVIGGGITGFKTQGLPAPFTFGRSLSPLSPGQHSCG